MILMSTNITYVVDMQSNFMNTFLNGWTQLLISLYSVGSLLDCYNIGGNVFTLIVKSVPHGNLNFNLDAIKIHDVQHQMTPPSKAELLRIHRLLNRYIRSLGIPVAKSILQSPYVYAWSVTKLRVRSWFMCLKVRLYQSSTFYLAEGIDIHDWINHYTAHSLMARRRIEIGLWSVRRCPYM